MAALASQKTAFAGSQVARRNAVRVPASRARVAVRAAADRSLWAPGVVAPQYLNGSLAGDYGERGSRGSLTPPAGVVRAIRSAAGAP